MDVIPNVIKQYCNPIYGVIRTQFSMVQGIKFRSADKKKLGAARPQFRYLIQSTRRQKLGLVRRKTTVPQLVQQLYRFGNEYLGTKFSKVPSAET